MRSYIYFRATTSNRETDKDTPREVRAHERGEAGACLQIGRQGSLRGAEVEGRLSRARDALQEREATGSCQRDPSSAIGFRREETQDSLIYNHSSPPFFSG